MSGFIKSISRLDRAIEIFLILLMCLLVIDVSWQVVTRFILPKPSPYTEEIARFLLIWISFLGSAYAFRKGMHLGIDFFVQKFSRTSQANIQSVVLISCAFFAIVILIIGGSNRVLIAFELNQVAASLGIKMGYVFLIAPITGVLFVLYTLEFVIKSKMGNAADALDLDSNTKINS